MPSGGKHKFVIGLVPVRIRILDRFGVPHRNVTCDVDVPVKGRNRLVTDGKGWLEVRCMRSTTHVDIKLRDVDEHAERHVLIKPGDGDDDNETGRRLGNLGFAGDGDSDDDAVPRMFRWAHQLDPHSDDKVDPDLDDIESDYKTLDDPCEHLTSVLDQQVHDRADEGEQT